MERFDRIQRDSDGPAHGAGSEPVAEPAPMANGTSHAGTDATKARPDDLTWKKRKVDEREDEDESMSELDDAPASKKVKNGSKIKRGADSDEAYAAKLQAEYDAQARSTRGGRTTKKKTVKKEKKHKKKSSVRVGADDDSEMEGPDGDKPVREKKGGFHVWPDRQLRCTWCSSKLTSSRKPWFCPNLYQLCWENLRYRVPRLSRRSGSTSSSVTFKIRATSGRYAATMVCGRSSSKTKCTCSP